MSWQWALRGTHVAAHASPVADRPRLTLVSAAPSTRLDRPFARRYEILHEVRRRRLATVDLARDIGLKHRLAEIAVDENCFDYDQSTSAGFAATTGINCPSPPHPGYSTCCVL